MMTKLDVTKPMVWADTRGPVHYVGRDATATIVVDNHGTLLRVGEDGSYLNARGIRFRVINAPERIVGWVTVGRSGEHIVFSELYEGREEAWRRCIDGRVWLGIVHIDAELEAVE
jgi:hypothetical protein